jgi:acetyltransferase-like isoleucine patch superfamily enzyme
MNIHDKAKWVFKQLSSPKAFYRISLAVVKGTLYIAWTRLFRNNVIIRFPFLCYTKVQIFGPGKVFIDRGCSVWPNTFEHLVIHTLSPEAEVHIGKKCSLAGLTIRCFGKVDIGDNVLTAANLIQDVPIASAEFCTSITKTIHPTAILIGNNTWLGGLALVLTDSKIKDGSVLGMNALSFKSIVGEGCLATGNPVMRPIIISKLDTLKTMGRSRM